jgi:DNA-directed RNA polymerase subunit RPC12/RpoP
MFKTCSKCNESYGETFFSKDKYKKDGLRSACKTCSSKEFYKFKQSEGYTKRLTKCNEARAELKRSDPKQLWAKTVMGNARQRAKVLGVEFSLTQEWLVANAVDICPLLNVKLVYGADKSEANCASIDRMNSALGYTPANCKVISFKANRIKTNATVEELMLLVNNITQYV